MESFDFDTWASLAKTAPDKFEEQRRECVEQFISAGTDIHRLRGLQSRIDLERLRARTAMKACLRLSTLMWDSLQDCQVAVNAFAHGSPAAVRALLKPTHQANVVNFSSRHDLIGKF